MKLRSARVSVRRDHYRWLHSSLAHLHPASWSRRRILSSLDGPPSSPRRDLRVPVWQLEDGLWSKERSQERGLDKLRLPEKDLDTILLLPASEITEDDLIFAQPRVRALPRAECGALPGGLWEGVYAPPLEGNGIAHADWARFLGDITHIARLAREGISALSPKRVLHPHSGFRTLLSDPWAVEDGPYDQAFRRSETEEVAALVGVWNGSAFQRRKVRVMLLPIADERGERRARWELFVEAL
ncbi:hypothetical protein CALVIDRAFT_598504 [Calocera viscosa TUFC12733]|uniref:Uncharacterized protein n=1 Tax=Calocera viscosa (strain TUFC12733) TaxID=1330018 RepID=A0A167LZB1_CALVF|nr:hypothetical protein CALVIDRAFT_598504 [Calocera viscosa TUFC12733]